MEWNQRTVDSDLEWYRDRIADSVRRRASESSVVRHIQSRNFEAIRSQATCQMEVFISDGGYV